MKDLSGNGEGEPIIKNDTLKDKIDVIILREKIFTII